MIEQEALPQVVGTGCVKGDFQARFRGNARVKFPRVTRLWVIEYVNKKEDDQIINPQVIIVFRAMFGKQNWLDCVTLQNLKQT